MYVSIHATGGISVHDADDCGRLHLAAPGMGEAEADMALRTAGLGEMQGADHACLDLAVLRGLAMSSVTADGWDAKWDAMVDYARAKEWISADGSSVRVHVER